MKRFSASLLLLLVLLLNLAVPSMAQELVGIVGNVMTPNNQALEKASVLVVYGPTQTRTTTATDEAGNFAFKGLVVGGPYSVQVSQTGFQPQKIDNIFLLAGKTANGTFVLFPEEKGPNQSPNRDYLTYIQQCRIIPPGEAATAALPPTAPTVPAARSGAKPLPVAPPVAAPVAAPAAAPAANYPAATPPAAADRNVVAAGGRTRYQPGSRRASSIAPPLVDGHYDFKSGYYIYHTGAPTTLRLSNGQQLRGVGSQSTESQLHQFLNNPRQQVDTVDRTRGWISFDRVFFMTGQATLTSESRNQLKNIALMMQSYPQTRLRIGGYTDSVGTYQMNRELSEARARTAWTALVEMGVSPSRLEARGYGPNYPMASNLTPAGRAMNRRLSLRVVKK
ncbi:OmpA family protein [Hymenobacter psychrophilus]|uniref:Outer membrane protein OmpA n=1 Tax=Hymenobacter psychrophilus TaxID=651662 RepID=A0A1H3BKM8_9BACT|nr:OmpA family protein [Hymenobacter psychrophilus]SDX42238.1 Outer membrane protein OmpA [Hymenobacter psychrophilus]